MTTKYLEKPQSANGIFELIDEDQMKNYFWDYFSLFDIYHTIYRTIYRTTYRTNSFREYSQ